MHNVQISRKMSHMSCPTAGPVQIVHGMHFCLTIYHTLCLFGRRVENCNTYIRA